MTTLRAGLRAALLFWGRDKVKNRRRALAVASTEKVQHSKKEKAPSFRPQSNPNIQILPDSPTNFRNNRIACKISRFGPSRCLLAKGLKQERLAQGLPVYDFGLGESKGDLANYLIEAGKCAFDQQVTEYLDPAGLPELRTEILRWLNLEDHYSKDSVVVSCGAKQALSNIFFATLNPGDVALFDAAPWVSYVPMVYAAAATPVLVQPARADASYLKISPEDLTQAIQQFPAAKTFLLNSPCNPTGQIYSQVELQKLLEICAKNQIFFILDRLYWKSVYDNYEYPEPVINELTKPWLIQIDGLSKNWRRLGGLRVGWSVAAEDLSKAMVNIQSHITSGTASTSQVVALEALRREYDCEMRTDLEEKRNLVVKHAKDIPYIKRFPTQGGFYTFWNVREIFGKRTPEGEVLNSSDDICTYLVRSVGVVCLSGSAFEQDGYLRLCFHVPNEELLAGLAAIKQAFSALA